MENNNNRNDKKSLLDPDHEQDYEQDFEQDNETYEQNAEYVEDEEEEIIYDPAVRRKWVKNTVISLLVAALIGNILAFWPQIYNMETLPFLFKSRELSRIEEIQSYKESVVLVSTDKGKGTGFHISKGYIVTNYHVIEDGAYSLVTFPENNQGYEAELAGADPDLDIALLKVDIGDQDLPFIEIEQERQWEPGEHIYVIGNPLYFTQIANEGKILGLVPITGRQKPVMAVDAPVFKGNSGSPVINEQGKAIAVIYATGEVDLQDKSIQAGLAVPLSDLDDMLQNLLPIEK